MWWSRRCEPPGLISPPAKLDKKEFLCYNNTMMKTIKDYPPNYDAIVKRFGSLPETTVFTYAGKVYSPSSDSITEDLWVHESTHIEQQGDDPDGWWEQYLKDDQFRLEQEVEAYHRQYTHIRLFSKNKDFIARFLARIAGALSGPMYGSIVSYQKAMELIKKGLPRG